MRDLYRRHNMVPPPPEFGEPMKTLFFSLSAWKLTKINQALAPQLQVRSLLNFPLFTIVPRNIAAERYRICTFVSSYSVECDVSIETVSTTHLVDVDDSVGCLLHKTKITQESSTLDIFMPIRSLQIHAGSPP